MLLDRARLIQGYKQLARIMLALIQVSLYCGLAQYLKGFKAPISLATIPLPVSTPCKRETECGTVVPSHKTRPQAKHQ
jgi:hypothetical protein